MVAGAIVVRGREIRDEIGRRDGAEPRIADLGGDGGKDGAALFKLGCSFVMAGDDVCGQFLGLEFGLGGGKLGAYAGGTLVDGVELGFNRSKVIGEGTDFEIPRDVAIAAPCGMIWRNGLAPF